MSVSRDFALEDSRAVSSCRAGRDKRSNPMGNPFVHVELNTQDVAKAKSFYRSMFDWTLNDTDMGGGMTYTMIDVGEGTGGGMMRHPVPDEKSAIDAIHWEVAPLLRRPGWARGSISPR
jgi:hypothetical protein